MKAIEWLLLDNLINRYKYDTNMTRENADEAMAWAIEHGFVESGKITESGKGYFLANRHRLIDKSIPTDNEGERE